MLVLSSDSLHQNTRPINRPSPQTRIRMGLPCVGGQHNLVPRVSSLLCLCSGIQEAVRQSDWLFAILGCNSDLRGVNDRSMSKFDVKPHSLPIPTPGGGGYMTCGCTGVCRPVFRKLRSSIYRQLPSYPLLSRILAENYPFLTIFANFWKAHPCLWKICRKRDPYLENFCPKNPTHPYGRHIPVPSTCYVTPPPRVPTIICNLFPKFEE